MEIVYDESTGTWGEYEEPYTTLDVQTEEDWNKLEFMINNFSRLEEENKELKRLLRLAVEDFETLSDEVVSEDCDFNLFCKSCPFSSNDDYINCAKKWKHAEEAMKLLGDDADD